MGKVPRLNLNRPKGSVKRSREQLARDVELFLGDGNQIEQLPGFTYRPYSPASFNYGEGARSGG